jgi:hypothetical protein
MWSQNQYFGKGEGLRLKYILPRTKPKERKSIKMGGPPCLNYVRSLRRSLTLFVDRLRESDGGLLDCEEDEGCSEGYRKRIIDC